MFGSVTLGLRRCWDLTEAQIAEALPSRRAMGLLLKEMAQVSEPATGTAKILLAVARMAMPECDWLDGSLRVEVEAFEGKTRLAVMEDLGGGIRELVFPRLVLNAPLDEFQRSLRLAPRAVEPLQLQGSDDPDAPRLVLTHAKRKSSNAPMSFEVAEDCLRKSLPPKVRKSLAPTGIAAKAAPAVTIPKSAVPKIIPPTRLRAPTPADAFAPMKVKIKPIAKRPSKAPKG